MCLSTLSPSMPLLYESYIIQVAKKGDAETLRGLIMPEVNVNEKGFGGITPLMWACIKNHQECVVLLSRECKGINLKSNYEMTALGYAASNGNPDCITCLLSYGATTDTVMKDGWTAFLCAAEHAHLDCMLLLLNNGAKINDVTMSYSNALHVLLANSFIYTLERVLKCIVFLLENGIDVNFCDSNGDSALHIASAKSNNLDIIRILLNYKADPTIHNKKGETPFNKANENIKPKFESLLKEMSPNLGASFNGIISRDHQQMREKVDKCEKEIAKLTIETDEKTKEIRDMQIASNKSKSFRVHQKACKTSSNSPCRFGEGWLSNDKREWINKIFEKSEDIYLNMEPKAVIDELWSKRAISEEQYQELKSPAHPTDIKKSQYLLSLIYQSPDYLDALEKALVRTQQEHVAQLLRK